MRKYLCFSAVLLITLNGFPQLSDEEIRDFYIDLVIGIDKAISPKAYQKTWKDEQAVWEGKVGNAKSIAELCALLAELQLQLRSDKAYNTNWPSKKKKWNKTCNGLKQWDDFGKHLINFETYLSRDAYSKEWDSRKNDWITEVYHANAEFRRTQKLKAPDVIIDEAKFIEVYQKVFKTSISGLDPFKVGEGVLKDWNGNEVTQWGSGIKMPGSDKAIVIYRKKYEVHTFIACWHAGTSKGNAYKVMNKVRDLVKSQMPDTYNMEDKYSNEFIDYKQYLFEYNSDKFADVQKRPGIVLGIIKEGEEYVVTFNLSEPYFKNQY